MHAFEGYSDKGSTKKVDNVTAARDHPIDAETEDRRASHLDEALNEALEGTFPASDPISSLCVD